MELIRNSFRKFESEYNLRTASSSPLLYKANTSEIHSALLKLCNSSLQHQLDHYYQWFHECFGDPDTIMGLHIVKTALELASRSSEVIEETKVYSNFFGIVHKREQSLTDYLETFDTLLHELVKARHGKEIDQKLSLQYFLFKMDSACTEQILKVHKTTYKGSLMTWATLRTCVNTIGEYTPSSCKDNKRSVKSHVRTEVANCMAAAADVIQEVGIAAISGSANGTKSGQNKTMNNRVSKYD